MKQGWVFEDRLLLIGWILARKIFLRGSQQELFRGIAVLRRKIVENKELFLRNITLKKLELFSKLIEITEKMSCSSFIADSKILKN